MLVVILVIGARLIWVKRAGRWKRPWSFPVAMALLGLALVMALLGTVLSLFGK
jgi:hypothetical protein